MITLQEFRDFKSAPSNLGPALEALWWLDRGEWTKAHDCVQAHEGVPDCDAVHAHLHRQEGDLSNAGYWYRRANRRVSKASLQEEWAALASEFLKQK